MKIESSTALIPFYGEVSKNLSFDDKAYEIGSHQPKNRKKDGIVFEGYRPHRSNNTYGSSGKKENNLFSSGRVVDMYV